MRTYQLILGSLILISMKISDNGWIIERHHLYNLKYTLTDTSNIKEYDQIIESGITRVQEFFNSSFIKKFEVVIHPNRHSLDSAWQKDWNLPAYKSECWMVGSGVAFKLDLLSPIMWKNEACEHNNSDIKKTQQLITHELVHVFHGQHNVSPDFSNTEGIDWFVEGLATYVSGQCDSLKLFEIKSAISNNQIPKSLDSFWTGKLRYGLSGSVVMFIDFKYGRDKLKKLLPLNKKTELLSILETNESDLLLEWEEYIKKL